MSKPTATIEVIGCSTIEAAFKKAQYQAGELSEPDDEDSEWYSIYSVTIKLVSVEMEHVLYDTSSRDCQPTFVFEIT